MPHFPYSVQTGQNSFRPNETPGRAYRPREVRMSHRRLLLNVVIDGANPTLAEGALPANIKQSLFRSLIPRGGGVALQPPRPKLAELPQPAEHLAQDVHRRRLVLAR